MASEGYNKKVLKLFTEHKHSGRIRDADGIGKVGNPNCGDVMTVFIKVKNNRIADIKYETLGCAAAIASSEALCILAKGRTMEQALKINAKDIAGFLGGLPVHKYHCSLLGANGLRKAVMDYGKKKEREI
ncbi:iron-sulfur cluster assembly scaffold protein [archaeon]|nr:iron-sulfur cluster assembly scaffold protein [archaeon]